MLQVSLRDRIRNKEVHRRTKMTDIARRTAKLKWQRGTLLAEQTTDEVGKFWSDDRVPEGVVWAW